MTDTDPNDPDILRAKLNLETARISWIELQRFYARGRVVRVDADLDLMDVAVALTEDDKERVDQWMSADRMGDVSPDQAQAWFDQERHLWTVVVAPWVLVQDRD